MFLYTSRCKKGIAIFVISLLVLSLGSNVFAVALEGEGPGKHHRNVLNAEEINDWHELDDIRDDLDGNYVLGNDLNEDMEGYMDYNDPDTDGWDPIGEDGEEFTGDFDGQGHVIRGLYICRGSETNVGLFGYVDEGTIQNLGLVNVDVTGDKNVGGLVGRNQGTVSNSYARGEVSGNSEYIGGLIGYCMWGGIVEKSYADVIVEGDGATQVGGLVGEHRYDESEIRDSYSTGDVSGDSSVGGLVGRNSYDAAVINSYSTGQVSGTSGGLIGNLFQSNDPITDSYWDTETSGIDTSAGGEGKTTSEMMQEGTFPWDHTDTWAMAGYPQLQWQHTIEITTVEELQLMKLDLDACYTLMNDLDFSEHVGWENHGLIWNHGAGFQLISTFTGTFDGQGHTILNLYIDRPDTNDIGLFGETGSISVIENIGLIDADVTGNRDVGVLVGENHGEILNSSTSGVVTGDYFGTTTDSGVGGSVGENRGTIQRSYSDVTVEGGSRYVGGLVGRSYDEIIDSYAIGNVSDANSYAGGLVGYLTGTIKNSYSTGSVDGTSTGGLVGHDWSGSTIDSYWNTETSGQSDSSGGQGRTTEEMTLEYHDNTYGSWDFADIWRYGGVSDQSEDENYGYPALGWQNVTEYMEITPEDESLMAGKSETYTAVLYDEDHEQIKDVTEDTNWSMEEGAGGSWYESTYTAEVAGVWTLEGRYGPFTDNTTLTVEPAEIYSLEMNPQQEQIEAGDLLGYDATTYDEFGNEIEDVTDETDWWDDVTPEEDSYWVENEVTVNRTGKWNVTGEFENETGSTFTNTSTLQVVPAEASYFGFGDIGDQTAGEPFEIDITAYDELGNIVTGYEEKADLTDVTGSLEPNETGPFTEGTWSGEVSITEAYPEVYLTVEDNGMSGESNYFEVEPADVEDVTIYPTEDEEITAGDTINFSAEAYDKYGNLIEDEVENFTWKNADEGVFHEIEAGEYGVNASYEGVTSSTVNVTVSPAGIDHIKIEPMEETVTAGEEVTYNSTSYDFFDNEIEEVTDETDWSISQGAGGDWTDNVYSSEKVGEWTVIGNYTVDGENFLDDAILIVQHDEVDRVDIDPGEDITLEAGETVNFSAEAYDASGNLITEDDEYFDWENASVVGLFEITEVGTYNVSAAYGGVDSSKVTVTVEPAGVSRVEIEPGEHKVITAGDTINFSAEAYDVEDNLVDDADENFTWYNTDGQGLFEITEVGEYNVSASYGTATSSNVTVTVEPAEAYHFDFDHIEDQVAGEPFLINITALDEFDNVAVAYEGTVELTDTTGSMDMEEVDLEEGNWVGEVNITVAETDIFITAEAQEDIVGTSNGFTVEPSDPVSIEVEPEDVSITAGDTVNYTARAFDLYENEFHVTEESEWSIEEDAGGSWEYNVYRSEIAGVWEVTAFYHLEEEVMTGEAVLQVERADPEKLEIYPKTSTIDAGEKQEFVATAYDKEGNEFNVTEESEWSIEEGAGGSWEYNVYTGEIAGEWTITGTYTYEGKEMLDTAELIVTPGAVSRVEIEPGDDQEVKAGDTIGFSASAHDASGNLITEDEDDFTWENASEDGIFEETDVGEYRVAASFEGVHSSVVVVDVKAGEIDAVVIHPEEDQVVKAGESLDFSAEAYDASGNLITEDHEDFTWENASEDGIFEETELGTYEVSAGYDGIYSGSVSIRVEAARVDSIEIEPYETIVMGDSITYHSTVYDEFGNEIGDVTEETRWSIDEEAGGEWRENEYTSEFPGSWTVMGVYDHDGQEISGETNLTVEPEEYMFSVTIEGEGDTVPEEGDHSYEYGEELVVEAIPEEGWYFAGWGGDAEGTEDEITIVMERDMEITANFEEYLPAYFELEMIHYDEEVKEGDEVRIEYVVTNTGELEGTQDIVLILGGEEVAVEEGIYLGSGEEYEGEFIIAAEDVGEQTLELSSNDDTVGGIEVLVQGSEDNIISQLWWLFILIPLAFVLLFFFWRRREEEEEDEEDILYGLEELDKSEFQDLKPTEEKVSSESSTDHDMESIKNLQKISSVDQEMANDLFERGLESPEDIFEGGIATLAGMSDVDFEKAKTIFEESKALVDGVESSSTEQTEPVHEELDHAKKKKVTDRAAARSTTDDVVEDEVDDGAVVDDVVDDGTVDDEMDDDAVMDDVVEDATDDGEMDDDIFYECKECGFLMTIDGDRCPYCEARVKKDGEENGVLDYDLSE